MAKTSTANRNKYRIAKVAEFRERREALKKARVDLKLSPEDRMAAQIKLQKLPRDTNKVRIRSRCQISQRSRGVYRKFKLSRILFRQMAHQGLIPGMVKASW